MIYSVIVIISSPDDYRLIYRAEAGGSEWHRKQSEKHGTLFRSFTWRSFTQRKLQYSVACRQLYHIYLQSRYTSFTLF